MHMHLNPDLPHVYRWVCTRVHLHMEVRGENVEFLDANLPFKKLIIVFDSVVLTGLESQRSPCLCLQVLGQKGGAT